MKAAKLLVVDDEETSVEIIIRFVEHAGHRAVGAGDAELAVAALKQGRFDLILLDLILPGRTGLQAMAEMKSLTRAPIYAMSGLSDPETRKDALLLGATGFFGKPLDLAKVLAVIAALPPLA